MARIYLAGAEAEALQTMKLGERVRLTCEAVLIEFALSDSDVLRLASATLKTSSVLALKRIEDEAK